MNPSARRKLEKVAEHLIDYERLRKDCGQSWQGPSVRKIAEYGHRILQALRIADEDMLCPVCGKPVSSPDHTYAEQGLIPVIGCPQVSERGFILTNSAWRK